MAGKARSCQHPPAKDRVDWLPDDERPGHWLAFTKCGVCGQTLEIDAFDRLPPGVKPNSTTDSDNKPVTA